MISTKLFIALLSVLGGTLLLAVVVWAFWIRPYLRSEKGRVSAPSTLLAALTDFVAGLEISRRSRHVPWFIYAFGFLLILAFSDLVLTLLLLLFGAR